MLALGISLLLNLGQLGSGFTSSNKSVHKKRQYLEEVLLRDNSSRNKIAVVQVDGVITSGNGDGRRNMVEHIQDQLDVAGADKNVKAIVLKINSPGGEVLASDEIYNAIRDFQNDTGKPVIASMQTLAASGGYYVAAPCRWIVANELTITGSIGVIMHGWNFGDLMEKIGVRSATYKSGKYKDMLSPFRQPEEVPAEERELVEELIAETYGKFTNIVATGRSEAWKSNNEEGRELAADWVDYVDGRVFSGEKAYQLGFVDEKGDFEVAVSRALDLANVSNANVIEYQRPFGFGEIFSIFGESETHQARTVKLDIGVEFPKLQAGCLYFIYPQAIP